MKFFYRRKSYLRVMFEVFTKPSRARSLCPDTYEKPFIHYMLFFVIVKYVMKGKNRDWRHLIVIFLYELRAFSIFDSYELFIYPNRRLISARIFLTLATTAFGYTIAGLFSLLTSIQSSFRQTLCSISNQAHNLLISF